MNELLTLLEFLDKANLNKLATNGDISTVAKIIQEQAAQIETLHQQVQTLAQTQLSLSHAAQTQIFLLFGAMLLLAFSVAYLAWELYRLDKRVNAAVAQFDADEDVLEVSIDGGHKILRLTLNELRNYAAYFRGPVPLDTMPLKSGKVARIEEQVEVKP